MSTTGGVLRLGLPVVHTKPSKAPRHCCHLPTESCQYGWSDVHFHRCEPNEETTDE